MTKKLIIGVTLIVVLLNCFCGCTKTSVLTPTDAPCDFVLKHIDTFFEGNEKYAVSDNEWNKGHIITEQQNVSFYSDENTMYIFSYSSLVIRSLDYSQKVVKETPLDFSDDRTVINARFSGQELYILSFEGDDGFSYNTYYLTKYSLNGVLESEFDITDICENDIPKIGLTDDEQCPLFYGYTEILFNTNNGSRTKKELDKNRLIIDIKKTNNNIYVLQQEITEDSEIGYIMITDSSGKDSLLELQGLFFSLVDTDELLLIGQDSLVKIDSNESQIICYWKELLCEEPMYVNTHNNALRIITRLDSDYSGCIFSDNNLYCFDLIERTNKEPSLIKLAAFGTNDYLDVDYLTSLFNLTSEEYRIETTLLEMNYESYESYADDLRQNWLEVSSKDYDVYYFPQDQYVDMQSSGNLCLLNNITNDFLDKNEFYSDKAFDRDYLAFQPFFQLAGSYYSEESLNEGSWSEQAFMNMFPSLLLKAYQDISSDPKGYMEVLKDGHLNTTNYSYSEALSLKTFSELAEKHTISITGIPLLGYEFPLYKDCGAFSFSPVTEREPILELIGFLSSDLVQSFSFCNDDIIPIKREIANLQYCNILTKTNSSVLFVDDNCQIPSSKSEIMYESYLSESKEWLAIIDKADEQLVDNIYIKIIFIEEYERYKSGVSSYESFVETCSGRIGTYIEEMN